jgi:hypothetical protein
MRTPLCNRNRCGAGFPAATPLLLCYHVLATAARGTTGAAPGLSQSQRPYGTIRVALTPPEVAPHGPCSVYQFVRRVGRRARSAAPARAALPLARAVTAHCCRLTRRPEERPRHGPVDPAARRHPSAAPPVVLARRAAPPSIACCTWWMWLALERQFAAYAATRRTPAAPAYQQAGTVENRVPCARDETWREDRGHVGRGSVPIRRTAIASPAIWPPS